MKKFGITPTEEEGYIIEDNSPESRNHGTVLINGKRFWEDDVRFLYYEIEDELGNYEMFERLFPKDQITIYPFDLTPIFLRNLSLHGGDEDWVIVCNEVMYKDAAFLDSTAFGHFRHTFRFGNYYIIITAHS